MKKEFLTILTFVFILQFASASYLSGDIMLYENGESRFDIETDTPLNIEGLSYSNEKLTGRTSALTTKEGKVWTFTLNLENYDNILLDVNLPANLKTITSINNEEAILDTQEKKISLINPTEKFLSISYTLEERTDYTFVFWIILIFIILIIFYIYMRKKLKKEKMNNILPLINESEQKIIDVLMKQPMRQKELRKSLEIPKASFSRYIFNLEKKKLILREGEGKNKVLKLK